MDELRAQAFLAPQDSEAWRMIGCAYQDAGYSMDAFYYELLARSLEKAPIDDLVTSALTFMEQALKDSKDQTLAIKLSGFYFRSTILGKDALPILERALDDLGDRVPPQLGTSLERLGEDGRPIAEKICQKVKGKASSLSAVRIRSTCKT